jgi:hypothetical protein
MTSGLQYHCTHALAQMKKGGPGGTAPFLFGRGRDQNFTRAPNRTAHSEPLS